MIAINKQLETNIELSPELLNYPRFGTKIFKEQEAHLAFELDRLRPDLLIAIEANDGKDLFEVNDGQILKNINDYSMVDFLSHPKIAGCLARLKHDYA
ncbi:MAG: hypothetical protein V3V74_07410 [Nitrosomonadaceae bacterium]